VIALSFAVDYFLANVAKEEKPNVLAIIDDDRQVRDSPHDLTESAGFRSLEFASAVGS
jgi:hypothetical protein